MAYLEMTDAEMRELTRQRRAETAIFRAQHRLEGWQTLQVASAWKKEQWRAGNRTCFYCSCELVREAPRDRIVSVDHVRPRSAGGPDHPLNFVLCCRLCNDLKANMPEWRFRRDMLPIIRRRRAQEGTILPCCPTPSAFVLGCPMSNHPPLSPVSARNMLQDVVDELQVAELTMQSATEPEAVIHVHAAHRAASALLKANPDV